MLELPQVQFCQLPNGRKLAWRQWGQGKPLIMLHGWSMSSVVFSEVARLLAGDFCVLCPDLPGHGQSEALVGSSLICFAESIEQWSELLDIKSTVLLGWSLGGQLALQLAANKQLRISKLLLVATTPRFCQTDGWLHGLPVTQVRALDRNLGRAYEKTMGDFFNLQFAGETLPKERYRQILKFAVRCGQLPQPDIARETLRELSQADLRPLLVDIEQPTLIIHGELDQIIPVTAGDYLTQSLPKAQFFPLPKVGHAPFFSNPEECVSRCQEFLQ